MFVSQRKIGDLIQISDSIRISVPDLHRGQTLQYDVFVGEHQPVHVTMTAQRRNRIEVCLDRILAPDVSDSAPAQLPT